MEKFMEALLRIVSPALTAACAAFAAYDFATGDAIAGAVCAFVAAFGVLAPAASFLADAVEDRALLRAAAAAAAADDGHDRPARRDGRGGDGECSR